MGRCPVGRYPGKRALNRSSRIIAIALVALVVVLATVGLIAWKRHIDVAARRAQAQALARTRAQLDTLVEQQAQIANLESKFSTERALDNQKAKDAAIASQARAAASDALPLGTYEADVGSDAADEYGTMVAKAQKELNDVNAMYLEVRRERSTLGELARSFANVLGTSAVNSFLVTGGQYTQDIDFSLNRWTRGISDIIDSIKYNGDFTIKNIEQLYDESEDYDSRARTAYAELKFEKNELDKEVQARVAKAKNALVALGGLIPPKPTRIP